MKNKKLIKNIKKGLCILVAGTVIGSFVGCSKNKNEVVSINITDDTIESTDEYTYIFNPEFVEDNALKATFIDENIDLLRETENTYYTSSFSMEGASITNCMSKGTFGSFFNNLVFPDEYTYVSPTSRLIDTSLRCQDFVGFNSDDKYQYVEAKLVVKKDIPSYATSKTKQLKKGDEMSSRALYVLRGNEVKLLAYEQTGVGSDCENVKEKTFGNIDNILISLSGKMDTDQDMTIDEAINFVNNYDNGTSKTLKK